MKTLAPRRLALALLPLAALAPSAFAWDAYGHRLVTQAAMAEFDKAVNPPAWLGADNVAFQIADQATVPDRWRSIKVPQLVHVNSPDHFINIEPLEKYGLTLKTLPPLRYDYVRQVYTFRLSPGFEDPDKNPAYADPAKSREIPGFLPYAIVESHAKAIAALRVVRILEELNDPSRKEQLEMARAQALSAMGILSHYVGDAAQPLHTTMNYNGWVQENPNGYTTSRQFHSFIDGGVLKLHSITASDVLAQTPAPYTINVNNPWNDAIQHIERSFESVEPLYALEKSGDLGKAPGKEFIAKRLGDGAAMLAALYIAEYNAAKPTPKDLEEFKRFDNFDLTLRLQPPTAAIEAPMSKDDAPVAPSSTDIPAATPPASPAGT